MAKTSEGAAVRVAMDGPTVDHDDLIGAIEARMREEYARSSDASESAAKTTQFLEKTGLNGQAFSWLKSILKKLPKKDGQAKAMDIIRSLEVGLPMVKSHVGGQTTRDWVEELEQAPADPVSEVDVSHLTGDEDEEAPEDNGDDLESDADEFDDALAALEDDAEGNVVKAFGR